MSTPKPHRRLSLTRPTGKPEILEPSTATEADRLASLEARCEHLEAVVEQLLEQPVVAPFRVSNDAGRTLMEVDGDDSGSLLRLFDAAGQPVAVLSAESMGGGLTIRNSAGRVIGTLIPQQDGGSVAIHDRDGNRAAVLEAGQEGGRLEVSSPSGERGAVLSATSEGGELEITHGESIRSVRVDIVDTGGGLAGAPEVEAAEEGQPLALQLRDESGLKLYSRNGRKAVALYAEGVRGQVRVYDESGACVYSQQ